MRGVRISLNGFFYGLVALVLAGVLSLTAAPRSYAQSVNDFTITDFDATYSLTNEDPQGLLTITESIQLDFRGQNQGILRALPTTYKGVTLQLKIISIDRDGEIEPYITYEENDNTVVRIGQAGTFITGKHTYIINYQVENVISFYDDFDELYWDINGDQWLQPFDAVRVDLTTGARPRAGDVARCFTGAFGSESSDCELKTKPNGLESATQRQLSANETLTIVQAYEKGYFSPPNFFEKYRKQLMGAPFGVVGLGLFSASHRRWKKYGKDTHDRKITSPYFGRPKNVSLLQAGYVAGNKVTTKLLSASIIDFATRGVLKIIEDTSGKKPKHTLELVDASTVSKEVELILLKKLFGNTLQPGAQVNLEKEKNKLHSVMEKLQKKLDSQSKQKGFYEISPRESFAKMTKPFVIALGLAILGGVFAEATSGVSVIAGVGTLIIVAIYGSLMTKRSAQGELLKEHMNGLNLYLSKAEKDRIHMQDAVAAPLAKNAGQPVRDVAFYEKLLPFAVLYGVEESWTNAFQDLFTKPPEWLEGSRSSFNAAALSQSLSQTAAAASQSFTAPASSGSSGFGGGGFSGGGGGGGGGGGW